MVIFAILFAVVLWGMWLLGVSQSSELLLSLSFILAYLGSAIAAFVVSGRLEGVLRTFVRLYGVGIAFFGLQIILFLLGIPEEIHASLVFPATLVYIAASVIVMRFLLSLNPENGTGYLVAAAILGLAVVFGFNLLFGINALTSGSPFYWVYTTSSLITVVFCIFFIFSAGWTWGGTWSNYFLFPYAVMSAGFAIRGLLEAVGLGNVMIADIATLLGVTTFFISLVRLATTQEAEEAEVSPA